MKKISIFIIILIILLGLYLVYNYFTQPVVKAPTNLEIPQNNGFRDPSGVPFIKGPTGPPPQQ
jgi:uncharacterized membrane protein YobD (UPF0266 family)